MMRDDYNYRFKLTDYTQLDRNRKRKVAVYGRVSTEHEAQIAALENQMQWYDDQARYHPNWEIQDRYIDEGITGTQAKKRPSFLRMIDDARQGKFDLIVTREVCRFARNVVDTLVITRELKGIGVEVYFIEDNIWTMDGDGELRLSLMATLAQEESRKTSERVRAGQKVSREKGVLYGNGNILGYDRVGDTYQINEEQAETVRMIFDLYLQGKGSLQIANELNARHRKSAMGLVKWCASSVVRVLKNATYTGTKCYNKSRNNNYLDQHRVLNLDASTYLYQEGDFPAIVSKEIWNKAQSIRINRRKAVALRDGKVTISNRTSEDIWVNKLRCSCGYACRRDKWHVRKDGSISYGYQCYNRINNGSKQKREEMGLDSEGYCGIRMYGDWKLEMMADTLFEQLLGDKHQIIQTALELLKKYYRETSRKDQQGNSERKIQLERIDTRLRNLTVMRADGEIGKEEYQQLRDQLEAERSRLEEEQKKAESVECREAMDLDRIQQALEELVHLKGKGVSRELIDQLVYRVTPVSETRFEWYLHLGPGTDAQASLLVEGKKGNCVPSVNGIREFLNLGEVKTDVAASQMLGSLPTEQLHSLKEKWNTLILDDLEELEDEGAQQALCGLLRSCRSHRILLLSRGPLPAWLLPFQTTGVLGVLTAQDLLLDRGTADKLLQAHGVYLSASELAAIHKETNGYPLALELLAQHLERGEAFAAATSDAVRQEIFYYYEETVFRRMEKATRRLLMELSLFETVTPELARIVTGDPHANERLVGLLRQTSMMHLEKLGNYTFWPIFRRFLQWELDQKYTSDQRCTLCDRGALYYELNEDYGSALEFYTRSGNKAKVADLLVKNAGLHPGMGHYLEMEPYYRALPEAEVRKNPALMQAMSMLCAMEMDFAGSERWYAALKEYRAGAAGADAREARSRLAWLDIGLPQREVEGLMELFPRVFTLIKNREISLPAFSVTSTLPSLMNGGKDFSPWSKRDTLLYKTLRLPVEAALGKDGVGLADCALTESLFEKGEDVRNQAMKLLAMLEHIRREGTPDMEFAVVGLLARVQIDAGRAQDARESLLDLRERFIRQEQTRFLPNLDAFVCRIDMMQGNDAAVALWYRDKAPRNPQYLQTLKRYQYFTQAMAQLALGDPQGAQVTLAPLEPYCQLCRRHIDGISLNLLRAVAEYRQNSPDWKPRLAAALDAAREFGFVRTVSQYGGAVLPLLEHTTWDADPHFLAQVLRKARRQGAYYPRFLSPAQQMEAPLSETERQVLQLLCAGKSNAEIGQALHIKLPTVKTHVSHILKKLQVSRRTQVRDAAQRLHFIDR